MTPIMAVARFQSLFRKSASLDVDKDDLKRLGDLLGKKLDGLLVVGKATAKANGQDIILSRDLPLTPGMRRAIHEFDDLDEELALDPILEQLAIHPPLEMTYGADVDVLLPPPPGRTHGGVGEDLPHPRPEPHQPHDDALGARRGGLGYGPVT